MIISSNIISSEMSSDAAGCGDRPALGLKSVKTMIDIKSIPTPSVVLSAVLTFDPNQVPWPEIQF